jgi:hypothetical protein
MMLFSAQTNLYVVGDQKTGWTASHLQNQLGPSSRQMMMTVQIEEAAGGYLVLMHSLDHSIYCDFWVETLDEAKETCKTDYGLIF